MSYSPMEDLKHFHEKFAPEQKKDDFLTKTERRINLISEEFEEVCEAILHLEDTQMNLTSNTVSGAKQELAKELADLLYVVYGTAEELGIPLQEVFDAVHESNMSKIWSDGTVRYNDFGKILKPNTYSPPDLSFIDEH